MFDGRWEIEVVGRKGGGREGGIYSALLSRNF